MTGRSVFDSDSLPPGLSIEDVRGAISASGYPLQSTVAEMMRNVFGAPGSAAVFDEWRYIDSDSGQARAIDLRVTVDLTDTASEARVAPILDLLVECKSSELPWVFFCGEGSGHAISLPPIAGLPSDRIAVSDGSGFTSLLPVMQAIGIIDQPYIFAAALTSSTFGRLRRKQKRLELSGSEAWSSVTLPLLKATNHLVTTAKPPNTWRRFDARLVIPVVVLDAPMLAVVGPSEDSELRFEPWVRVERYESLEADQFYRRPEMAMFDAVHVNHLESYLRDVIGFATTFADAVTAHQDVLAEGGGVDPKIGELNGFSSNRLVAYRSLRPADRFVAHAGDFIRDSVTKGLWLIKRRPKPASRWAALYTRDRGPEDR